MTPKQLKALRKRMGLTQVELAKRMGVCESSVTKWEAGAVRMTGPVSRLLKILETAVDNRK